MLTIFQFTENALIYNPNYFLSQHASYVMFDVSETAPGLIAKMIFKFSDHLNSQSCKV